MSAKSGPRRGYNPPPDVDTPPPPAPPPAPPRKSSLGTGPSGIAPPRGPEEVKAEYETKVLHWLIDTLGSLDEQARGRVIECASNYWQDRHNDG